MPAIDSNCNDAASQKPSFFFQKVFEAGLDFEKTTINLFRIVAKNKSSILKLNNVISCLYTGTKR